MEDDADFAALTSDVLEAEDDRFAVTSVETGRAGIDRMDETVDCVVCDYQLGSTDGLTVLTAIREDYPDVPFILFTGEGSETIAAEAIEAGVSTYLQKEPRMGQFTVLANRIRNHVDQYRTSKRVEDLERHYETVATVATDAFFTVDLTSGSMNISEGISQFGYDPETLDGTHDWWRERIHPDDRDRMLEAHDRATTPDPDGFDEFDGERGRFTAEFDWRRADGTYAHVEAAGITIFDDDTAVEQIGTMRDVSDRRARAETLELFQHLIDESNALVFINDPVTGELLYANQTAADELGYALDDLIGTPVYEIETEFETVDEWHQHVDAVRERSRVRFAGVQQRADGSTFPVEVNLTYVSLDEDYMVAIARNITERKQREAALEEQNERLERFVSIISHDLRNPLNVVSGYVDLLRSEYDDERLERIDAGEARMESIVADLLYLAREGTTPDTSTPVDIAPTAREAWQNVPTRDATLVVCDPLPTVRADRDRLLQVFENLFKNAVDHGGSDVTVTVRPIADGFEVADDGSGIATGDRERVFEDGFSTAPSGSGLGLTIVSEVVEGHGWSIEVTEGADGGAAFRITGLETVSHVER